MTETTRPMPPTHAASNAVKRSEGAKRTGAGNTGQPTGNQQQNQVNGETVTKVSSGNRQATFTSATDSGISAGSINSQTSVPVRNGNYNSFQSQSKVLLSGDHGSVTGSKHSGNAGNSVSEAARKHRILRELGARPSGNAAQNAHGEDKIMVAGEGLGRTRNRNRSTPNSMSVAASYSSRTSTSENDSSSERPPHSQATTGPSTPMPSGGGPATTSVSPAVRSITPRSNGSNKPTAPGQEVVSQAFCRDYVAIFTANLRPTDDFLRRLNDENFITAEMVRDLQRLAGQRERTSKLVDMLKIRVNSDRQLARFCQCLELSGHALLADYVRSLGLSKINIGQEILAKFPKIDRYLTDVEKDHLKAYIANKIREEIVAGAWRERTTEKARILDTQAKELEQAAYTKQKLQTMEKEVEALRNSVLFYKQDNLAKDRVIEDLNQKCKDMDVRFQSQLSVLSQGQLAQSAANCRLEDNTDDAIKVLSDLNNRFIGHVEPHSLAYFEAIAGYTRAISENLQRLMEKYSNLLTVQTSYQLLVEEKKNLLDLLDVEEPMISETTDTIDAFHTFVEKRDNEHRDVLKMYQNQRNNAMREVLPRQEMEILKEDLAERDARIESLRKELEGGGSRGPVPPSGGVGGNPAIRNRRRFSIATEHPNKLPPLGSSTNSASRRRVQSPTERQRTETARTVTLELNAVQRK